jgi:hypothetical protein
MSSIPFAPLLVLLITQLSYLAESRQCLHYKNQPVNAVYRQNVRTTQVRYVSKMQSFHFKVGDLHGEHYVLKH